MYCYIVHYSFSFFLMRKITIKYGREEGVRLTLAFRYFFFWVLNSSQLCTCESLLYNSLATFCLCTCFSVIIIFLKSRHVCSVYNVSAFREQKNIIFFLQLYIRE